MNTNKNRDYPEEKKLESNPAIVATLREIITGKKLLQFGALGNS